MHGSARTVVSMGVSRIAGSASRRMRSPRADAGSAEYLQFGAVAAESEARADLSVVEMNAWVGYIEDWRGWIG
jgi:hypothetical protein